MIDLEYAPTRPYASFVVTHRPAHPALTNVDL